MSSESTLVGQLMKMCHSVVDHKAVDSRCHCSMSIWRESTNVHMTQSHTPTITQVEASQAIAKLLEIDRQLMNKHDRSQLLRNRNNR